MIIRTRLWASVLLYFFITSGIILPDCIPAKTDSKDSKHNPFRSLLPVIKTQTKSASVASKSPSINKQKTLVVIKKVTKQTKVSKGSLKKTSPKKAVFSRTDQLSRMLKLEDIIETSEGRYAFIDEKKVKYFVQQGEWLDEVYVKRIAKNLVVLKEIDGETTITLELKR